MAAAFENPAQVANLIKAANGFAWDLYKEVSYIYIYIHLGLSMFVKEYKSFGLSMFVLRPLN